MLKFTCISLKKKKNSHVYAAKINHIQARDGQNKYFRFGDKMINEVTNPIKPNIISTKFIY